MFESSSNIHVDIEIKLSVICEWLRTQSACNYVGEVEILACLATL